MRTALGVLMAVLLLAGNAPSEERSRDGFSRAMGIGVVGSHSTVLEDAGIEANRAGLHVDTRLGGHITDRFALHCSGRGIYLLGSGTSALMSGMIGAEGTYYLRESAPCYYFSALAGVASTTFLTDESTELGLAGAVAFGYEWRRNHGVEFELLLGLPNPGDPYNDEVGTGQLLAASIKIVSYYY